MKRILVAAMCGLLFVGASAFAGDGVQKGGDASQKGGDAHQKGGAHQKGSATQK